MVINELLINVSLRMNESISVLYHGEVETELAVVKQEEMFLSPLFSSIPHPTKTTKNDGFGKLSMV